jgi:hypothetical protein
MMKITAIKKNRVEKGSREVFLGSNPHSNGDGDCDIYIYVCVCVCVYSVAVLYSVVL